MAGPELFILAACYGGKVVTDTVRGLVSQNDNTLTIDDSNGGAILAIFGPDPLPGVVKVLAILYRYGEHGGPRLILAEDSSGKFRLSVGPGDGMLQTISPGTRSGSTIIEYCLPEFPDVPYTKQSGGSITPKILGLVWGPTVLTDRNVYRSVRDALDTDQPVLASNPTMGGDTWPGTVKTAAVFYNNDGDFKNVIVSTAKEGTNLTWQ